MGDKKKKKAGDEKALKRRVHELEAQAQVDTALYRIAQAASTVTDMQEFYAAMHGIVGELMDASNFYIALYDEDRQMINFPYFVDEVDLDVPDPNVWEPFGVGNARGTTAYLLRTSRPLLLEVPGNSPSSRPRASWSSSARCGQDWLGVPLKSEGRTLGVLVVQTYTPDKRLTRADLDILTVVGGHIATALERTRLLNETRQRSAELALVNDVQRGLAERLEMQAMYDLVGDRIQEDLRRAGRRHRHPRSRQRADPFPVHDRARRAVPRRADGGDRVPQDRARDARAARRQRGRRSGSGPARATVRDRR